MAKLFVPACGDRLTLIQPWQFNLYLDYRNFSYTKVIGLNCNPPNWATQNLTPVVSRIEAGTELECDRVYIRSTSKSAKSIYDNYDSITWKVISNGKLVKGHRFWVKLADSYSLEFDPNSVSRYHDRIKP